jgi:hypothetical protein
MAYNRAWKKYGHTFPAGTWRSDSGKRSGRRRNVGSGNASSARDMATLRLAEPRSSRLTGSHGNCTSALCPMDYWSVITATTRPASVRSTFTSESRCTTLATGTGKEMGRHSRARVTPAQDYLRPKSRRSALQSWKCASANAEKRRHAWGSVSESRRGQYVRSAMETAGQDLVHAPKTGGGPN